MAESISVSYRNDVTVAQTLDSASTPSANADKRVITHQAFNDTLTLNSGSTPDVTKMAAFTKALSAGAATIDLTALTGTNGATVNGNGDKVRIFKAINPSSNANSITLTEGASNGYELAGNGWTVVLQPGQHFTFYADEDAPTIGGSAKTIDLAGTGSQTLNVMVVMG